MKFSKKLAVAAAAALALVGTAACSNGGSKSSSSSEKIPSKITKKTTVVFWNAMPGVQGSTLKKLTNEFEKKNPKITVKLENQGAYNDLQAKINSTLQSPNNLPTITQAYPGWLWNAAQNKMLVDMTPYINDKNVGWGSAKASNIRTKLLDGAKIKGTQYGIPFNKSIETLTYNKTMFKKYGIKKVPTTMDELKQVSETIYKKSNHKVVGAGFDSLPNYYTLGMKNEGINFTDKINFTGAASKKVINFYADGIKKGYFRTAGSEHYLSGPFANEKVAMFVGTSAGEGFVKQGVGNKFTYDVAPRPGKYTLQQGTDIYMFNHASAEQKAAAFKYIKFLTSKSSQIKWANATGYIPVNNAAIKSSEYKNNKDIKLPAKLEDAMKHLYSVPVAKNSNAAFQQLSSIQQNIYASAQKGQNINSQINAGKQKFDAAWKQ
ncbi:extracellular solute-binding protein [Lactobacillus kefiranofaciens]|uniref:extracellular solute-binding protein n=1 Tax=Lactobacillus kefiranofaciens TaxID=267818 RepID=UPI0006D04CD7|nr:extracellular solute-binding protein [Lactobacillus kefiranofaciens]KRL30840.1 ABC transporter [Lactobacillus kefiranofaciens subsp. kefirgranum DSM 10550 = JCM 8572]MCJ2172243.1 extracellular solute-binding protein [Lactobacillus kefiranofaciens]MCP9331127.1 extracellular solute-binding protein [Lactobacillus kefiranofaciens]PAK98523.1 ABC transporter substrate-binding protein [Lactobacillus kefiranofaciens]QNT43858.1 extracellular solute-binding protein [Lactobacillus kefiranofaciens]